MRTDRVVKIDIKNILILIENKINNAECMSIVDEITELRDVLLSEAIILLFQDNFGLIVINRLRYSVIVNSPTLITIIKEIKDYLYKFISVGLFGIDGCTHVYLNTMIVNTRLNVLIREGFFKNG